MIKMGYHPHILLLLVLVSILPGCFSWGWFSSSKETQHNTNPSRTGHSSSVSVTEFSVDGLSNEKGMKLVESAKNKMVGSNSCWQNAYQQLFAGCSQILAVEEKRKRFAWHLSDCFYKDSGRAPFPYCDTKSDMVHCLKKLDDSEHKVFLEFLLETNSICYQLQSHIFKRDMERLVNDLKDSAEYTEQQLQTIQGGTNLLLHNSNQIQDSLTSMDIQVQNVAETTKDVKNHMDELSKHSEAVYKQSKEIADTQSELREGQEKMKEKLNEGMTVIQDSYANLDQQVKNLRDEATNIEMQIGKVGETVTSSMNNLQNTANDIENMAGKSLNKQQQLLDGQSTALKGLQLLTEFQSEALEESRGALQQLTEYGRKQQEELLQRQEQLQRVHDHLIENSNSILAAQEAFESKQASMFIALDKLFALHNAMLLESRIIKAFFIYCMSIFIIYMFTSTKQTYNIRAMLYIGLCTTFLIEIAILRLTANNIEQQSWLINVIRSLYVVLASAKFLHAIYTYRDYEVLNHQMILTLTEKVNAMQKTKALSWETDSDVSWPSWIETELPEEVDDVEDPDYLIPEEVGENSITTTHATTKYNLRNRCRQKLFNHSTLFSH